MSLKLPALWLLVVALLCVGLACEPKGKPAQSRGAEIVKAVKGPVATLVAGALRKAGRDERRVVVYVGASWCEPCRYFQQAVEEGELPRDLRDLRFLKFDHDEDAERLEAAGYGGQMLPRFVVPGPDGRGSERRFEGSIKGPGAMDNMLPRLRALLDVK